MQNLSELSGFNEQLADITSILPSPDTATTASLSPNKESDINIRVQNLELLVSNLLTRIVELEKNNSNSPIYTTYNWSNATKDNVAIEHTIHTKSRLATYFANRSKSSSI